MLTPVANIHHSRLPALGAIVTVRLPRSRGPYRRFIVESFPLNDSADPRYSRGIHTCNVKALDNGATFNVAGHLCYEE